MGGLAALCRPNPLFGCDMLADEGLGAVADARGLDDDAAASAPDATAGREKGAAAHALGAIEARQKSGPHPRFVGLINGGDGETGDMGGRLQQRGPVEESSPLEFDAVRAPAAQATNLEVELAAAKRELQAAEQEQRAFAEK